MARFIRLLSLIVTILWCTVSFAQNNRVTVVSSTTSANGTIRPECQDEAGLFIALTSKFPQPSNWHFVIVCDDPSWDEFVRKSGQYKPGVIVYGTTYVQSRVTYISGWRLLHPDTFSGAPTPARIVAHEIAHVVLKTEDDTKAEAQAAIWMRNADFTVSTINEAPKSAGQ